MSFYSRLNNLTFEEKIKLMREAQELSFNWWVDVLDCSKSFARVRMDIAFEDALALARPDTLFTVIQREPVIKGDKEYFEFGFRTTQSPDYFLWICVYPVERMFNLLVKHRVDNMRED